MQKTEQSLALKDKSAVNKSRAFSTAFEDHEGLLHRFSRAGLGRLSSVGVNMEYDDIFQENCVSLVRAQKSFNPEAGITFSAYMGRSAMNNFNKLADRLIRERTEINMLNVDDITDEGGDSGGYMSLGDAMDNNEASVLDKMIARQEGRALIDRLHVKRDAAERKVIRDLICPSNELVEHHRADYAHCLHGRELGESSHRVPQEIDLRYIVKYHGLTYAKFAKKIMEKLGVDLL